MSEKSLEQASAADGAKRTSSSKKPSRSLQIIAIAVLAILLVPLAYIGYIYAATPEVIRNPKLEHYHFRLQVLVNGKAENFALAKYQEGYSKDQCTADLPTHPFHFHDQKDQFVHVHWEGMTGGLLMKYYGWNYVGGPHGSLGYKLSGPGGKHQVAIHGSALPPVPSDAKFYVYTGDETSYRERSFDDWKNQDIEVFLGKTSNFPAHEINKQSSLLDHIFPKAYAHNGVDDGDADGVETEQEKLTRLNNLLGNVVIFVQPNKPTDAQIKSRFNMLTPLTDSTCGG